MRRFALIACLVLTACGIPDAIDRIDPIVHTDPLPSRFTAVAVDADTGEHVAATLRFSDEAAPFVRNLLGRPVDGIDAPAGAAAFGLSEGLVPRPWRPVRLRVHASAHGYRPSSTRVVTADTGQVAVRILLERHTSGRPQVAAFRPAVDAQGRLAASFTATDPSGELRLLLARGALVGGDSIRVRMRATTDRLLATIPGGLDAGIRTQEGDRAATMTTGGVVDVSFDDPAAAARGSVAMIVSRELFAAPLNAPVREGDPVQVYRWLEADGVWREEQAGTLALRDGRLEARFEADLPGTYSAGYHTIHCSAGRVDLEGNVLGGAVVAWRGGRGSADGLRVWRFHPGATAVSLLEPPDLWRGELVVYHGAEKVSIPYDGLCGLRAEASLRPVPVTETEWTVSIAPCTAVRTTEWSTFSVGATANPGRLRDATELLTEPPFLQPFARLDRDRVGRPIGASFGTAVETGSTLRLVQILGSEVLIHERTAVPEAGTLDAHPLLEPAGLCVSR